MVGAFPITHCCTRVVLIMGSFDPHEGQLVQLLVYKYCSTVSDFFILRLTALTAALRI